MPFDPNVEIQVRLLCHRNPGLEEALVHDPRVLAALVSNRLLATVRVNAIALVLVRKDVPAARRLLRLQPFMETVDLRAFGLEFEGFDCEANFNLAIASFMPSQWQDQRRLLSLLALTVPRASEQAGLWFAQLLKKDGYELEAPALGLLCLFIWYSLNPTCKAAELINRAWSFGATLGESATEARTFGLWLRLTLQAAHQGLPAWLPGCKYGGLDIVPLGSAQDARELAAVFGDVLYADVAEKLHADSATFMIARKSRVGQIIGCIEIAPLRGRDYLFPVDIKGRKDEKLATRLPSAAYHLLEQAHRHTTNTEERRPRRIPKTEILAERWNELLGPYLEAVGPSEFLPLQPDAGTIHALLEAIQALDRVAVGTRGSSER